MKFSHFLVALLSLTSSLALAEFAFEGGANFRAIDLSGRVTYACQERREGNEVIRTVRCIGHDLEPASDQYFQGAEGLDADHVELNCKQASGVGVSHGYDYDGAAARTKTKVNLWTPRFLRPKLLAEGVNDIEYIFRRGSQPVAYGRISVFVERLPQRLCRDRLYDQPGTLDCNDGAICERYFRDENYCSY